MQLVKLFSHSVAYHFSWMVLSFVIQKLFSFVRSHLLNVGLSVSIMTVLLRKSFLVPVKSRLFLRFFFYQFSVSGIMLRSLIHLKLNFVKDDKCAPIYILRHVNIHFDKHNLLRMLSFFPVCVSVFFFR